MNDASDTVAPLNAEGDKTPSTWKDGVVTTTAPDNGADWIRDSAMVP